MSAERDPTRRDIPINPPEHSSRELWSRLNFQCSIQAGLGKEVVPEPTLMENNDGKHPSEVDRIKKVTQEVKP
jgi:hypothetical protein